MTRFERKNRTDISYKLTGPVFDALDNFIKEIWRINDEEYDFICDNISDNDIKLFMLYDDITMSDRKYILNKVNEILDIKINLISINRDYKIDELLE